VLSPWGIWPSALKLGRFHAIVRKIAMAQNSPTSNTLVLGTAFDYTIAQVRIFVESLRRYYPGEAMLLVNSRDSDELVDYLSANSITPVYFDSARWMVAQIEMARYIRYGELLRGAPGRYSQVLLTDVVDVVFQGHPFHNAPEGDLLCFLEVAGRSIGDCVINSRWILELFGEQEFQKLRKHGIICSGTTMGTPEAIIDYIDRLLYYAPPQILAPLQKARRGHDQGIHNYLLRNGLLPFARLIPNGVHVFTVGSVEDHDIGTTTDGQMLTQEGVLCPIVHQYTYKQHLTNLVRAAYPPALRGKAGSMPAAP